MSKFWKLLPERSNSRVRLNLISHCRWQQIFVCSTSNFCNSQRITYPKSNSLLAYLFRNSAHTNDWSRIRFIKSRIPVVITNPLIHSIIKSTPHTGTVRLQYIQSVRYSCCWRMGYWRPLLWPKHLLLHNNAKWTTSLHYIKAMTIVMHWGDCDCWMNMHIFAILEDMASTCCN